MKKSLTRLSVAAAAAALATATLSVGTASAVPDPVLRVELGPGTTLAGVVAVDAKYNLAASRTEGIPALKKLRGEMWDINPPFNGRPLREQAARAGLTTKAAYVNAVASDLHHTYSAVQRAIENRNGGLAHERPTGACTLDPDDCEPWSATHSGVRFGPESLSTAPLAESLNGGWGHGELGALRELNGFWGETPDGRPSGHLHMHIDPTLRSYGFAYVQVKEGSRIHTYAASVASAKAPTADTLPDEDRHTWLYRAAWTGEQPTGILSEPPAAWSLLPGGSGELDPESLTGSLTGEGGVDAGSVQAVLPLVVTGAVIAANLALQGGIRF